MKPQELRIGNYVRVWSEIYRVNQILPSSIIHNYNYDDINDGFEEVDIENVEPIELTEEWLLKFGFESNIVGYKIDNDRFIFELYFYDAWNLNYVEKQKFGNGSAELSGYWKIHELQNIFSPLPGKNLK
ncbi:hypothetical protein [Chryseobacterium indologenes]|uniref:hypothetical protein n=1 Tax=Chryseobacterium indologenes TaxID=253 RepID=UPI001F4B7C44|nr:hypothetical protein [Chryseobacterium indologenes]